LEEFHQLKDIFISEGAITTVHRGSDIPKPHMLIQYAHMIHEYSTMDGFNMQSSKQLHVDYGQLVL
jgi:hypothetical protein